MNSKNSTLKCYQLYSSWSFVQDVHYNYDRGTNFADKTYRWIDLPGGKRISTCGDHTKPEPRFGEGLMSMSSLARYFFGSQPLPF